MAANSTPPRRPSGGYPTLRDADGPQHVIVAGIFLGAGVPDAEQDGQPTAGADGDDADTTGDDEDGVVSATDLMISVGGATHTVNLRATNLSSEAATLTGWIDFDGDQEFDNATERAQVTVPAGTNDQVFTLSFAVPPQLPPGTTYARFRLSTDPAAQDPTGAAGDGEVEDYLVTLVQASGPGIHIEKSTNGSDADTMPGPSLIVSSTATFTYVVTNTGDVSLANVSVNDDNGTPAAANDDFAPLFQSGDTNGNQLLDPDETWTYLATRTVTAGAYANLATVVAENAANSTATVTDSDASHHFGVNARIEVDKSTNGQDADQPPGPSLTVGSQAEFLYQVRNLGNVALANVQLTDDNGTPATPNDDFSPNFQGGDTNGNSQLDVGEVWTYRFTRTVTAGQHTNLATVVADDSSGAVAGQVTDTDVSNHFGMISGIDLESQINGADADQTPGPYLVPGSQAEFTYQVSNTGDAPLSDVALLDNNGTPQNGADDFAPALVSGDTNNNQLLDPGEVWRLHRDEKRRSRTIHGPGRSCRERCERRHGGADRRQRSQPLLRCAKRDRRRKGNEQRRCRHTSRAIPGRGYGR